MPGGGAGRVQPLRLGGAGRERGGVLGGARELDAERVVGLLADDARAREHLRERARELLVAGGGDEPGARRAPSPARARGRRGRRRAAAPKRAPSTIVGGSPVGRHEPLGDRDDGGAPCQARPLERRDHLAQPARGHREEHVVGARDSGRRPARCAAAPAARRPAGRRGSRARPRARCACSAVRVCSVVRSPPRASSTASAVPNDPAPITRRARRARAVGSERARERGRLAGLGSRLGLGHLMSEPAARRAHRSAPPTGATGPAISAARPRRSSARGSIEELSAALGARRRARAAACASPAPGTRSATSPAPTACSCASTRSPSVLDVDRDSRARARAGRHHDPRAEPALGRARAGDGEPRRHRRADDRRRDLHRHPRHGARLRNISAQVAELDARARRRLDAALLGASSDAGGLPRRARRARRAGRDRRGDAALRAGVHAARRRRARAAGATRSSASRSSSLANDHFEFFVFPHADTALTRTNNRTDEPPRPRGGLTAYAQRRAAHQPRLRAVLPRRAPLARARSRSSTGSSRALAGRRERVDRSDRDLRQPAPRALHRDGVRAAARAHARGRAPRARADRARSGFAVPFPIEVRTVAPTTRCSAPPPAATAASSPCTCIAGMAWRAVLPRRRGDHGRARRAPALGQAPLPDRRDAARRATPIGIASRPCARGWTRDGRFANEWTDRVLGPVDVDLARTQPRRERRRHLGATADASISCSAWSARPPACRRRSRCVDLDALWANADDMERRAAGQADPPREQVACAAARCRSACSHARASPARSPSRCPRRCGWRRTASEDIARRLPDRRRGARCASWRALDRRARRGAVTVMVDCVEQLELIDRAARVGAPRRGAACACASTSTPAGGRCGGRVRIGAKRSPVHTPEQAAALAREIARAATACSWSG